MHLQLGEWKYALIKNSFLKFQFSLYFFFLNFLQMQLQVVSNSKSKCYKKKFKFRICGRIRVEKECIMSTFYVIVTAVIKSNALEPLEMKYVLEKRESRGSPKEYMCHFSALTLS